MFSAPFSLRFPQLDPHKIWATVFFLCCPVRSVRPSVLLFFSNSLPIAYCALVISLTSALHFSGIPKRHSEFFFSVINRFFLSISRSFLVVLSYFCCQFNVAWPIFDLFCSVFIRYPLASVRLRLMYVLISGTWPGCKRVVFFSS